VWIPKPGSAEQRPLSIPAVGDRIVQAALKLVIEPIFEADMLPCSFGFRPRKTAHDALQVLIDEAWRGRRWVVETDIASCFESIPHDRLVQAVEERIVDRQVLKLLRAMLRAGVMEAGVVKGGVTGTPQGGVVSPVLCNIYRHRLDRAWQTRGVGALVRYADDLLVLCRSRREAEHALAMLTALLAELGLAPKQAKTRIVHLTEAGEGIDCLGFAHQWVRAPGGPHAGRYSTPATEFVNSRRGSGCGCRSSRSCRRSIGSCAAGRATFATGTPPASSTRSGAMRSDGWRCLWPNGTSDRAGTAGG
jgi:group II intron reverse transcriptase/maturase